MRQKVTGVALVGVLFVVAALESISIGLVFPLATMLAGGPAPTAVGKIFDTISAEVPAAQLVVIAFLLAFLAKNGISVFATWIQARFVAGILAEFGNRTVSSQLDAEYESHLNRDIADSASSVENRIYTVAAYYFEPACIFLAEALVALAVICMVVIIEPVYAPLTFGAIAAFGVILNFRMRRIALKSGRDKDRARERLLQSHVQNLIAIGEIISSNRSEYFADRVKANIAAYADAVGLERFVVYLPRIGIETGIGLLLFGGLAVLASGPAMGPALIGTLGLFGVAAMRLLPCANRLLYTVTTMNLARESLEKLLPDIRHPIRRPRAKGGVQQAFDLSLMNLRYAYPGAEKETLSCVDFSVAKGEHVAITGMSGAGKTTLLHLLSGLLTPSFGSVLVGGRNVSENIAAYREIIGYVPQSPTLLEGTIAENVVFGWDDGDPAAIHEALETAQLSAAIATLPGGIESHVGEMGARLSGGQQQRVALARALYRKPNILILDEPTSALDVQTERELYEAIQTMPSDMTVIMVSHRNELIERFDRVLVLTDGTIVERTPLGSRSSALSR